jgi:hypothetical protein
VYFLIIVINFILDPFGIHSVRDTYLNDGRYERYQNIGIIRNSSYDSIITGSSLSENMKPSLIDGSLSNTIKIPISGASAREQSMLINSSNLKNVQKIIWDVHYTAYKGSADRMHDSIPFPQYLYDESIINDLQFYGSFDSVKFSFKKVFFSKKYFSSNFDEIYNWYDTYKSTFNRDSVYKYIENKQSMPVDCTEYTFSNLRNSFVVNILPIIKNNPNIEFKMWIPPYTHYYYLDMYKCKSLEDILEFKKYLIVEFDKFKNVKMYDFSIDYKTINNLDNYKDTHHFNQKISDKILLEMQTEEFLVNKADMNKNIKHYKEYLINRMDKDDQNVPYKL